MRTTKDFWTALEMKIDQELDAILPVKFLPLQSVKSKRKRAQLRINKHGPTFYVEGNASAGELNEWRDIAVSMGTSLLQDCKRRRLSPSFIFNFGTFQYACGMVVSYVTTWTEDGGKQKSGAAGGNAKSRLANEQKVWVAREVVRIMKSKNLDRRHAEERLGRAIVRVLKSGVAPAGHDLEWLKNLVDGKELRDKFFERRLSETTFRQFSEMKSDRPAFPEPSGSGK
jgi:hypothetical protein